MKLKFTFLITALLLLGNLTMWGQTTADIIITAEGLGLTTSYPTSNTTASIGGVEFSYVYLMKSGNNIQAKASDGVICNKTAIPGTIKSITVTHSGTARSSDWYYSSDGNTYNQGGTFSGTATLDFSSFDCSYFKITRKSNAAYWINITITYTPAPTGPTQLTFPTDFSGIPGNGEIAFSWTAVAYASSYTISYTPAGGTELTQAVDGGTTSSYTLTNLTNGTSYSCKIKAVGDETTYSDSDYTTAISVTPTSATYNIEATSNNSSWGTVELSGNVITATAENGCRINATAPFTITEGTATVNQNNNVFTVGATSDCKVQINFEAIPTYTVTFNAGTGMATYNSTSYTEPFDIIVQENTQIDLSTITVTPPTDWTFYGWATASVEATQTTPTIISGIYTPTADVTLYAVYSKSEGGNPSPTAYTAGDEGDFVLAAINDNKYYSIPIHPTLSSGKITGVEITVSTGENGVLYVSTPNAVRYSWTIANSTNGQTISDGSNYLYHSNGGASGTNLAYGSNTTYTWSIISEENGLSFRGMSGETTNGRGLLMQNTTFGGYSLTNEDATNYSRLLVLPIATSVTTTYNTNTSVYNLTSSQDMPTTVSPSTDVSVSDNATVTVTENSNITINNLTIEEGSKIVIDSLSILDIKGTFTNTNAAGLIIKDGGQLIFTSSAKSNVQGTVEKNFVNPTWGQGQDNTGWHFISSPVASQTISSFIENAGGDYDLYKWVGSEQDDNHNYTPWYNYKDPDNTFEENFIVGVGYLASYQSAPQFDFSGVLNTGTTYNFDIPVHNGNNDWENYVLLGNPYTYDMDWSKFTKTNVYDGLAIANPKTGTLSYSTSGSVAVGQGFMIYTTAENPALSYDINSGAKRDSEINEINIIVESENCMDNAIIRISEEVGGFKKLANMNKDMALVYLPVNGTDYAIASYTDDVNEIPLCFKTPTTGYYTISMKPQGEFNYIHLFDKIENVEIDMLNRGSYEFIGSPKDMENRFTITLNRVNTPNNTVINNFAFISNDELVINNIEGEGTIQIIDIVGRVASQYIVSGSTRISTNELSKGVYMVRLIDNTGSKTQKIVVK